MKKNFFTTLLFLVIIGACFFYNKNYNDMTQLSKDVSTTTGQTKKIVLIDPGHDGKDPGKVIGKIYEKDINLKIAKKLQVFLEKNGYIVIMTKESDKDLPKNKQSEMYKRKLIANGSGGDIFVSIHQNSSSNSSAKGAQVYYFSKSEESKKLAQEINYSIKVNGSTSKKWDIIANKSYYVLRTTKMPAVLVECGFLTNAGDKWKLTTQEYQDKIAGAIYIGIDNYFKNKPEKKFENNLSAMIQNQIN